MRLAVLVAAATLLAACPGTAQAAPAGPTVVLRDGPGDVWTFSNVTIGYLPATQPAADVLRARVTHGSLAVSVRLVFDDLQRVDTQWYYCDIHTPGLTSRFVVEAEKGLWRGRALQQIDGEWVRVPGLSHHIDYGSDVLTLRVPRSLLGRTTVGAGPAPQRARPVRPQHLLHRQPDDGWPDAGVHRTPAPGRGAGYRGLIVRSLTVASSGRSSTCRIASTTVSGSIQWDASYSLPSCWWHLQLHRRGRAPGEDRGDPDAVLLLLRAQRVGQGAQAELRGGVRRPLRGWRPGPGPSSRRRPSRARPGAPAGRRGSARPGATRLTASCDCQASVVSSATRPRSTTPAAWTTESSESASCSATASTAAASARSATRTVASGRSARRSWARSVERARSRSESPRARATARRGPRPSPSRRR